MQTKKKKLYAGIVFVVGDDLFVVVLVFLHLCILLVTKSKRGGRERERERGEREREGKVHQKDGVTLQNRERWGGYTHRLQKDGRA